MARKMPKRGPKGRFVKSTGTRRRRRRRSNPATVVAANPRRRKRRVTGSKRRTYRRRRRNPGLDAKGVILAGLGGAAIGAANYGLDSVTQISSKQQAAILVGGGLVLGLLASTFAPDLGKGIAGAGIGLGGYKLASLYLREAAPATNGQTQGLGQLSPAQAQAYLLGQPSYAQLAAVQAQLGAIRGDLGAVQADLGATDWELAAITADLG